MRGIRRYWHRPSYWAWLWRYRVTAQAKAALGALVASALLAAGLVAATGATTISREPGATEVQTVVQTFQQLVTVQKDGTVVTRPAPSGARRTVVQGMTQRETAVLYETIRAPGGTRVVTYEQVRTLPSRAIREVVTEDGGVTTVARASPAQTVIEERVVTNERMVTITGAAETRTVTDARTLTDVRTVVDTRTVTEARTVTTTQPVTVTAIETTTVTEPPVTVTVTVPKPKG